MSQAVMLKTAETPAGIIASHVKTRPAIEAAAEHPLARVGLYLNPNITLEDVENLWLTPPEVSHSVHCVKNIQNEEIATAIAMRDRRVEVINAVLTTYGISSAILNLITETTTLRTDSKLVQTCLRDWLSEIPVTVTDDWFRKGTTVNASLLAAVRETTTITDNEIITRLPMLVAPPSTNETQTYLLNVATFVENRPNLVPQLLKFRVWLPELAATTWIGDNLEYVDALLGEETACYRFGNVAMVDNGHDASRSGQWFSRHEALVTNLLLNPTTRDYVKDKLELRMEIIRSSFPNTPSHLSRLLAFCDTVENVNVFTLAQLHRGPHFLNMVTTSHIWNSVVETFLNLVEEKMETEKATVTFHDPTGEWQKFAKETANYISLPYNAALNEIAADGMYKKRQQLPFSVSMKPAEESVNLDANYVSTSLSGSTWETFETEIASFPKKWMTVYDLADILYETGPTGDAPTQSLSQLLTVVNDLHTSV